MKFLIYLIFTMLFSFVTFFGLGPVLMADGLTGERMLTLLIVIFIYVVLTFVFIKCRNKIKHKN
ncbi:MULTISPECIES: DUF6954 family protein [Bacillus]|uniref:DUF6954 family protein n=1 Tax=Bacillus TaxID=1386 RepID=UPI000BB714F1